MLIIQPWFTGKGHPAQSLINTASAIGKDVRFEYLVSFEKNSEHFKSSINRLASFGRVFSFCVNTQTGKSNTIRALFSLVRLCLGGRRYQRVFFFDATLTVLAFLWPVFSWLLGVDRICVLHLHGPEFVGRGGFGRFIVRRFLRRSDVWLYLRTEELTQAWLASFAGKIRQLPSLEIPDDVDMDKGNNEKCAIETQLSVKVKFGIIGQIRPGKGIDKLVPIFLGNPSIGKLTIAGAYYNDECRAALSVLERFEGFIDRFLSEDELLQLAREQDYLLMLYDEGWDPRLESAVLYLAARVNRPVIVYDKGWSGRKVREFRCGLLVSEEMEQVVELLSNVPRADSNEYLKLLDGVKGFRDSHSVASLRSKVLRELIG